MTEKPRGTPPEPPKRLKMPRGINSQPAIRRAHHRINNWLLAGLISEVKANSLHRGVEGQGHSLEAETNEKLLSRLDALEARQTLVGRALQPAHLVGRA